MSDMVEKVARAICESSGESWESSSIHYRETCSEFARAAIGALREPTIQMMVAGRDALQETGIDDAGTHDAVCCFQDMLSAALSQSQSPNTADTTSTGDAA